MKQPIKNITLQTIHDALRYGLPGELAHRKMLPEGRTLTSSPDNSEVNNSAVLLLLFEENGELQLCLTQRNSNLKHHPGQISFPGGRCEPNETDYGTTALRETEEEIGISRSEIQLLGQLSEVYVSVSNFKIQPYIGFINHQPIFTLNDIEVDEMIIIPLSEILNSKNRQTKQVITYSGQLLVPCYQFGKYIVWGATAMMIAELEAILT